MNDAQGSEPDPRLQDEIRATPNAAARRRRDWVLPWTVITLATLYCHWFILTNDGVVWDGWYWREWLQHRNWAPALEYTSAQALPFSLWVFSIYTLVPDIIVTGMSFTFLCLVAEGLLVYELAVRLARLGRGDALAIALLTQAMPLFSAAQEVMAIGMIFFRMLFYAAALLAVFSVERRGWRHVVFRAGALLAFFISLTTIGALLVFYGGFYLLLLLRQCRTPGQPFLPAARRFVMRFPDYLVLPPVVYIARLLFMPQFGWYESYNKPTLDPGLVGMVFNSFFENVIPYHAHGTVLWFAGHPYLTAGLVAGVVLWCWKAPARWGPTRGGISNTIGLFAFGVLLFLLAVGPLALIGKGFRPDPTGEWSRHCLLTPLPFGVLVYALIRPALHWQVLRADRWIPPMIGCLVVVLGGGFLPIYSSERLEWIFSRSLLRQAITSPVIRESSIVILGHRFSLGQETVYGTYGFAGAFGELTRLVTSIPPANQRFFVPMEIELHIKLTTMLPNEFKKIDPSGQQIYLEATRNIDGLTDWNIISRYLRLHWFGTQEEMDAFLESRLTLKATVLKAATPPPLANGPPASWTNHAELPEGSFTNNADVQMVRLPAGWWAARFETTQSQYEKLMGSDPSIFKDPFRPVECVSWNEATEFCRRLTESERATGKLPAGHVYRLPTAAEFETMAGQALLENTVTSTTIQRWTTEPAGSMPPNSLGLHDVIGNVWEWCLDWHDGQKRYKTAKGGAWIDSGATLSLYLVPRENLAPHYRHAAERQFGDARWDHPDQGFWTCGFRCVLAPPVADDAIPIIGGKH